MFPLGFAQSLIWILVVVAGVGAGTGAGVGGVHDVIAWTTPPEVIKYLSFVGCGKYPNWLEILYHSKPPLNIVF